MNILNFRYCLLILSFMLLEKEFYNHNAFTSFDNLYIINKNNSKYYILNKKNNYAKNLYIFNNHRKLNEEMHNVKENIENDNEDTSTNNFSENDDKYISQNNYKGPKKEEKKEDNEIEQKGTTEVQSELNEVKEVKKEDNKKKESEIDKLINDDILNKKEEEKRNEKEIEVEEKKENKSLELGCPNKFNFLEEVSSDETNNVLSENSLQNYSKFIEGKVQINMENENSNYIKEHGELLQNNEIKTQRIYDENEKKEKGSSHSIWSKCSRSCNGGYTINSDTKEKKNCNEQPCRNCSYKKNINYNEECLKLFQINYDYVKSKLLCKEACLNYNFCSEFSYNYSTGKCILLNTVDELCEIIKEQNNEIYPADYDFHVCSKKLDSHHKKNIILSSNNQKKYKKNEYYCI
ncbi:conserved Plasmodium protein, unknown function [Plasmodium relictum]|uniref:Apple domain-containing protein n=1 Tax=Plasmodium relictum TaxID=85471 RepID=A0A1J1H7B5_PLARL|nr:conserved Plasmodium protein, unknown function [Plasmodium relictum]CRH00555.1 conserved Plasmodium protein, unknown function [Plasmodium relictum]